MEWTVIPYNDYLTLIEKAEMLDDVDDYDRIQSAIIRGEEELIPSEIVDAILDGQNPIKVFREYRLLTQHDLADKVGISVPYLSQIETQKRQGSIRVLTAIARALNVTLDMILVEN